MKIIMVSLLLCFSVTTYADQALPSDSN